MVIASALVLLRAETRGIGALFRRTEAPMTPRTIVGGLLIAGGTPMLIE